MSQLLYKFLCEDSNYKEWSILDEASLEEVYHNQKTDFPEENMKVFKDFNPLQLKLINQDVFTFTNANNIEVRHSTTKTMKYIPGVLKLQGNHTYGKIKDKYYYRCCPDDKRFPEFLIAYKMKSIGFSKNQTDLFVLFIV